MHRNHGIYSSLTAVVQLLFLADSRIQNHGVEFETLTLGTLSLTFHGEQRGGYLFGLLGGILKMHPWVFTLYVHCNERYVIMVFVMNL